MHSATMEDAGLQAGVLRRVRNIYWMAIGLIAILATVSYFLLGGIIQSSRADGRLLDLAGRQQMLSQRIVVLTNEASDARTLWMQEAAVKRLHDTITEFANNYAALTGLEPSEDFPTRPIPADALSAEARTIFEGAPHHLGFYTDRLIASANRYLAALPSGDAGQGAVVPPASRSTMIVTTTGLAEDVLDGYSQLAKRLTMEAAQRVAYTEQIHAIIFYMMMALLVLEALFIFRPMFALIERRTQALVDAHNDMAHAASHDSLTGLRNRTFLTRRFEKLIEQARDTGGRLAVIQIDLDEFKQINDTLGHAAGDIVLKTTAQRIDRSSRNGDLSARLGGDEFVIVLPSAGEDDDIGRLASRILAAVNAPVEIDGALVHVGASAGVAVYPDDADNADDLMVHSDLALYCAKRDGRGIYRHFSDGMRTKLDRHKRLEADIRDAVKKELFDVHFQPQVSLKTGAVTGIEALVRWRHPEHGNIAPAAFLPVAETSGLICGVGRIVIRKAIRQAALWRRAGYDFGRIGVNVSGAELADPGFIDFIFSTLRAARLPPECLSVEVLESVVFDNPESGLVRKLEILRKSGIHIELDDFGTGYATLAHINSNAVDRLKIDRRFISDLNVDAKNARIVRAITELARSVGLEIIAEGAETQEELDALVSLGCYDVQGYSIAFPMPANEAADWLASRSGARLLAVTRAASDQMNA